MENQDINIVDYYQILDQLSTCLDKHQLKDIDELITYDVWNQIAEDDNLKCKFFNLICNRLNTLSKYRFKTLEMLQSLLIQLAYHCNPKELLIDILSEIEKGRLEVNLDDDDKEKENKELSEKRQPTKLIFDKYVKLLFTPLRIVINKIPKQKAANLKWSLGLLSWHFSKISISTTNEHRKHEDEEDEQNSMIKPQFNLELNKNSLQRFDYLLPPYLIFLSDFVDQFTDEKSRSTSAKFMNEKIILIKALLSIFYHPLMHLDLYEEHNHESNNKLLNNLDKEIVDLSATKDNLLSELTGSKCLKHNFRIYSYQTVNLISRLEPNLFELYQLEQLICRQEENSINLSDDNLKFSFGVQAYVTFVLLEEKINFLPSIYSPIFIFQHHLQYILPLLERTELLISDKGLHLVDRLISKISEQSLKPNFIDFLREYPLDKCLIKIMRFSSKDEHRRLACKVYKKLIRLFNNKGRYNFLFKTIAEPNQFTGVRGLMITIYKDFLIENEDTKDESSYEFIGSNLQNFMRLVMDQVNLKQEEFDLIENLDLLMSYLNFIRFLLLWDKGSKETGLLNEIKSINDFVNKLKKKTEYGRHFLQMKINSINPNKQKENKKRKKKLNNEISFEFDCMNGDENLFDLFNNMNSDDELVMYKQGLINIDMMESVLARVSELISNLKL